MTTLKNLYYNPAETSSFGGVERLYQRARRDNPAITRRDVKHWLAGEVPYTIHKSVRHRFKRNKVIVNNKDDQWQADLADMQSLSRVNGGFKHMLTIIDIFSKYAWIIPLKSKRPAEIVQAFNSVFEKGRKPVALQTDRGTEFKNRWFQQFLASKGIKFFTSQNQTIKCAVIERFNRTIKSRIYRYFTAKGTHKWTDVIQQLVDSYNTSYHRSIKMRPVDVNDDNRTQVYNNLYKSADTMMARKPLDIAFGDKIRVNKLVHPFRKGYLPNWSDATYDVVSVNSGNQTPMVRVRDSTGSLYGPRLYPQEVQIIQETPQTTYRIEKILTSKTVDGTLYHRIKWVGFPSSFNSWEPASNVFHLSAVNS